MNEPPREHAAAVRVFTGLPSREWEKKKCTRFGGRKREYESIRGHEDARRLRRCVWDPLTMVPSSDALDMPSLVQFGANLSEFIHKTRATMYAMIRNNVYDDVDWQRHEFQVECARIAKRSLLLLVKSGLPTYPKFLKRHTDYGKALQAANGWRKPTSLMSTHVAPVSPLPATARCAHPFASPVGHNRQIRRANNHKAPAKANNRHRTAHQCGCDNH